MASILFWDARTKALGTGSSRDSWLMGVPTALKWGRIFADLFANSSLHKKFHSDGHLEHCLNPIIIPTTFCRSTAASQLVSTSFISIPR